MAIITDELARARALRLLPNPENVYHLDSLAIVRENLLRDDLIQVDVTYTVTFLADYAAIEAAVNGEVGTDNVAEVWGNVALISLQADLGGRFRKGQSRTLEMPLYFGLVNRHWKGIPPPEDLP